MKLGSNMHPKSLWSCLTLCDPMDCSQPGFSVHWILQSGILQWVALPSSRRPSWPRVQTHDSCVSRIGRHVFYHYCLLGSLSWEYSRKFLIYNYPTCNTGSRTDSKVSWGLQNLYECTIKHFMKFHIFYCSQLFHY